MWLDVSGKTRSVIKEGELRTKEWRSCKEEWMLPGIVYGYCMTCVLSTGAVYCSPGDNGHSP